MYCSHRVEGGYNMHLSYSSSKYKDKTYKSYSIATSYREGDTVRKKTLWPIGKLTDEQARQIRLICKVAKNTDEFFTNLKDIVVKETKAYLDIAMVNAIWNFWHLDNAFQLDITESELSTPLIAKILTINRCVAPCSHYSIPKWVKKVALRDIFNVDLCGINDDKIYYELDKIERNKERIEEHLFHQTYTNNANAYQYLNYDLSTSYFIGHKCKLSAFGKGKADCHGRRQVLLGVLINDEGYPFKWDVFTGNTAEVNTLEQNINACRDRFKLTGSNVTMVFDRGIISKNNAELVGLAKMKYISALDHNQIASCGFDLKAFKGLSVKQKTLHPKGFKRYDETLYFFDAGIITPKKRLVIGFNPAMFTTDRRNRSEKFQVLATYLKEQNIKLQNAKRDRSIKATNDRITQKIKRLKIKKYFYDPVLHPIKVKKKTKKGIKIVNSFKVEIKEKPEVVAAEKLLDGVCVFISNHVEQQGRDFKIKAEQIIKAYREKTKVEDVFKNIKSFLKIRPFFVNTEIHVKAVYTICMLSYFINRFLSNRRKEECGKDYLNSKELYAPFQDIDYVTLKDKASGQIIKKSVELPKNTRRLLKQLKMEHIAFEQ